MLVGAGLLAGVVLASCDRDREDGWRDADGPTAVVRETKGDDDHCDFGSITYFQLEDQREAAYVRDPEGITISQASFEGRTQDLDAELPDDAVQTPYVRGDGTELWLSTDRGFIYLVRGDVVERLPLVDPAPWCA